MIKKNAQTCKWKVEYRNMAYDMGVGDSWDQYYFTWVGAHISRLLHNHLRSWGGGTKVVRVDEDPNDKPPYHSAVCQECGGWVGVKYAKLHNYEVAVMCATCGTGLLLARTNEPLEEVG